MCGTDKRTLCTFIEELKESLRKKLKSAFTQSFKNKPKQQIITIMTEQRNSLRRDRDEDEDLQKQTKCCKELQDKIFDILKENGIVFDRTQILKKAIEVENNNDHVSGFVLETDLDKFVNLRCDLCLTTNPNNDDENDPAKLENQQQECLSLGLLLFGMFCFSGTQNVDKLDNL
jgi:hypothetical protein